MHYISFSRKRGSMCRSTCGIHFYVVSHSVSSKLLTKDYSLVATGGPQWDKSLAQRVFSKCRYPDSNWGAHPIEPRTSTLRPKAQPLGQPTWVDVPNNFTYINRQLTSLQIKRDKNPLHFVFPQKVIISYSWSTVVVVLYTNKCKPPYKRLNFFILLFQFLSKNFCIKWLAYMDVKYHIRRLQLIACHM